jgi:probable HAF family extracellular repeat protein
MNNRGDIVGYSGTGIPSGFGPDFFHGFLWRNGAMQDAGTPSGQAGAYSSLFAINDSGVAAGTSGGFVHTWQEGTWTALGFAGEPADINKSGTVAGSLYAGNGYRGFIYRDGVLQHLPTLGGQDSHVTGINDRGVAVGSSMTANGDTRAFAYDNGAMIDLGTLGGTWSRATDINSRGVIVGEASLGSGATAFVYDKAGMRPLIEAVAGLYPVAINDRGDIVGTMDYNSASFVYMNGEFIILEDIPAVRAGGWVRIEPTDINDRGWITGHGRRSDGSSEAILLKP